MKNIKGKDEVEFELKSLDRVQMLLSYFSSRKNKSKVSQLFALIEFLAILGQLEESDRQQSLTDRISNELSNIINASEDLN